MDLSIAGENNKYYQILFLMVCCELVNIAYSFFFFRVLWKCWALSHIFPKALVQRMLVSLDEL